MNVPIRTVVWGENIHEQTNEVVRSIYPNGMHNTIAAALNTDSAIETTHCGRPSSPHGFHGEWQLAKCAKAARLWLPQLGQGKRSVLEEVHKFVNPHEVCPILPFPATWPRSPMCRSATAMRCASSAIC